MKKSDMKINPIENQSMIVYVTSKVKSKVCGKVKCKGDRMWPQKKHFIDRNPISEPHNKIMINE